MPLLEGLDFSDLAEALTALGVDAWLLYDFRRGNPVAERILGPTGMGARRLFIFLPRSGKPAGRAQRIELQPLAGLPGGGRSYGSRGVRSPPRFTSSCRRPPGGADSPAGAAA